MPSIVDVVDLIAATLAARSVPVPVTIGQEFQASNTSPPSVLFVPRGDRFEAASARHRSPRTHETVATRSVGLEARIWGAAEEDAPGLNPDLRAAELLVDKVIIAIRDTLGSGAFQLEDGEWADASAVQLGRLYLLRFRVSLPVVPDEDDAPSITTTYLDVESAADVPSAGVPAATTTTVELGTEESASPAP